MTHRDKRVLAKPVPGQLFTDGQVGHTQPASQFSEAEQLITDDLKLSQERPAEVSQAAADAGISQEEWTMMRLAGVPNRAV